MRPVLSITKDVLQSDAWGHCQLTITEMTCRMESPVTLVQLLLFHTGKELGHRNTAKVTLGITQLGFRMEFTYKHTYLHVPTHIHIRMQ